MSEPKQPKLELEPAPHSCECCGSYWPTLLVALHWKLWTYDALNGATALEDFWACVTGPAATDLRWPIF
jgi:hypothetical protein